MEEWVNGLREAKEFWMQHRKRQEFKQKINNQGTFTNESISLHNADKCLVSIESLYIHSFLQH